MANDKSDPVAFRSVRLSVLFCDIQGFTAMAQKMERRQLNTLLHDFVRAMSAVVHRRGGQIDKVMGDGILAFFPPSSSRRSTAFQAVSAGLSMQEESRGLRERWQAAGGDLRIRIGIATGPVEVSELALPNRRESALIGHHVNLASRLQDMAPAGSILVSEGTWQSARDHFDFQRIEGLEIKGFADAVVAFRAEPKQEEGATSGEAVPRAREVPADNSRRYRRLDLDLDLSVHTARGNERLRGINISEGGIFIATEMPEPKGTPLTIEARLPTSSGIYPIAINGRVVWTGGEDGVTGMGVRFTAVQSTEEVTMARLRSPGRATTPSSAAWKSASPTTSSARQTPRCCRALSVTSSTGRGGTARTFPASASSSTSTGTRRSTVTSARPSSPSAAP
jgi:class 3 adenylate cyclase